MGVSWKEMQEQSKEHSELWNLFNEPIVILKIKIYQIKI